MSLQDYLFSKPELRGKRILLRPLKPSDVQDLRSWTTDKSLYKYWGKGPSKSDLNPELLFSKSERPVKSFHWGIVLLSNNKVIGDCWVYLIENNRQATVAFRVASAYQGCGYAAEALQCATAFCFSKTELQRLQAGVDVNNHASYKTLERAGFSREGLIRQGKLVNTFCDYYLYGLLKP